MDFKLANQLAGRISQGENSGLHEQLVSMCTPYLLYVKQQFGFYQISKKDVVEELAADAVADSIMVKEYRRLPFTICLQNAFRNCCRKRCRILREHAKEDVVAKCETRNPPSAIGVGPSRPSPEIQAQRNEEKEIFHNELKKHKKFSKTIIYERMRHSTYKEMAIIFNRTLNECKRVFWSNFNEIRSNLRQRYVKEEDF